MPEPTQTPYLRAASIAGPLAAVVSIVAAALAVLFARGADGASVGGTIRTAAQVWLTAIGSGLTADGVAITVVPVGSLLVAVAVVAGVSRWSLPDPVDDLPAFVGSAAGFHAVVAAVVAAFAGGGGVDISLIRAAAAGFVVGGLGAGLGAVRKHRGGDALWFTVSDHVRRAVRGAVPAVMAVLGVAVALVLALLFLHLDRAGDLWALLDPGAGGGVALAVGSLLAVPTLVLWTTSALLGPGFALGADTSVDLTGAQLGAVPGFPVLAALPSPGAFADVVFVLGLVPVAAGMLAGWRADTGGRAGLVPRLVAGAAAGGVAGFVLGVLVGASGGAIGPGRMEQTGPPALTPLLVAVPIMAMGGALGAALAHYRDLRASQRRDDGSDLGPDLGTESGTESGSPRRARLWQRHQPAGPDRGDEES